MMPTGARCCTAVRAPRARGHTHAPAHVTSPHARPNDRAASLTAFHKVSKRRFDDISSVAVAFALDIEDGAVTRARIGLGGIAATPLRAYATEQALLGKPWNLDTVRAAAAVLEGEGTPLSDHRAGAEYRARMLGTALQALYAGAVSDPVEVPA